MTASKRLAIAGVSLATIGLAAFGSTALVSAATPSSGTSDTSIVDKLAQKFNLNRNDVQSVFDTDHQEHHTEMQQQQQERLAQAVTDGKLTQAQADHISSAMKEIDSLMSDGNPHDQSDTTRSQIKQKMDDLHTWATDNNVSMQYIGGPGMAGPGGRGMGGMQGGHGAMHDGQSDTDPTTTDNQSNASTN